VHPGAGDARHPDGGRLPRRGAGTVSTAESLDQLLAAKSIAIFCGPGGVGKTSVAAASAAVAASRLGGKVLVVTVDPARRLVDTPPTRNALDFLEAPERMADFFGSRLLRWLTMPYRVGGKRGARMVNLASRPFYQVADRLLGGQFLEDIAEFFLNFQTMYDGFVRRARSVERLLHDRRTTFVVVSTLEAAPLREAEFFIAELQARKLHLGAAVLN